MTAQDAVTFATFVFITIPTWVLIALWAALMWTGDLP